MKVPEAESGLSALLCVCLFVFICVWLNYLCVCVVCVWLYYLCVCVVCVFVLFVCLCCLCVCGCIFMSEADSGLWQQA